MFDEATAPRLDCAALDDMGYWATGNCCPVCHGDADELGYAMGKKRWHDYMIEGCCDLMRGFDWERQPPPQKDEVHE